MGLRDHVVACFHSFFREGNEMSRLIRNHSLFVIAIVFMVFSFAGLCIAGSEEADPRLDKVKWVPGPCVVDLGTVAELRVPEGHVFVGGDDIKIVLEAMHNFSSGTEVGLLTNISNNMFLIFRYDEAGYVKDDEKGSLDADAILKSIKEGNERANKERKNRGWEEIRVVGWDKPPYYNDKTNNLEWAIRGRSVDGDGVNFQTRLLGRKGYMKVTLITGPDQYTAAIDNFRKIESGFAYKPGYRYAEYRQGTRWRNMACRPSWWGAPRRLRPKRACSRACGSYSLQAAPRFSST
jgi:uncharacterized membrane-anchored protein